MFQQKRAVQTELTIGVVFVLALLTIISISTMTNFEATSLPISVTNSESVNTFNAVLPERSLAFQLASGTSSGTEDSGNVNGGGGPGIIDGRLLADAPGAEGALAAIFPATAGFDVYAIDPATGQGTFAFRIIRAQVFAAQLEAFESGEPVVINEGSGVTVYALPSGECLLQTSFPDGKTFDLIFAC